MAFYTVKWQWLLILYIVPLFTIMSRSSGTSSDGEALLSFRAAILDSDGVLLQWKPEESHPCKWRGVTCDPKTKRVIYLSLPHHKLSGSLSPELGKLDHLKILALHDNNFYGTIPSELGNCSQLQGVFLQGNYFSGFIPNELGNLSAIKNLDISSNSLGGNIPISLGNLSKLTTLNVSANFLVGSIPNVGVLINFSESSFLGNRGLCGKQINVMCKDDKEAPGTNDSPFSVQNQFVRKKYSGRLLISASATVGALLLVALMCFWGCFLYKKFGKNDSKGLVLDVCGGASGVMFHGDLPYSSKDIIKKFETLNEEHIIGCGGFGTVYKLAMDDGNVFALKRIMKLNEGFDRFFERELEILGSMKHRFLVNLRGYCNSPTSKLLIYDFLPGGSLDEALHGVRTEVSEQLDWDARLNIIMGAAKGLAYLHHDCSPRIIHRDIKSSNILLDANLEARVSDFGLAKLLADEESHITTIVAGTFGYLAPEYMQSGRATEKTDVYSFGVLVLEVLSGKRPTDASFIEKGLNIVGWLNFLVTESRQRFCSPGSYCPTTTSTVTCSSGHYCRMGSTSEQPCFQLATCNPHTANQNIHAYGVMLIVALSTILLIIYNCSDQVLTTRERRLAKRREAAARHVRETAQARERWKSAKDVAKKHATGLQEQLSQTFSRKKSLKQTDQSKGLGQLPPVHPGSSGASEQQSATSKGKRKDNNLTKMLQSIDNNPNSNEGFNLQIGDRNIKKHAPKSKQNIITHSQIFKYAYGQLEKEKAMQQQAKNLTFSGVISMATDTEIKTRPVIEIAFKDLTLTLKGKNKHIMRCVTGKLMPGRVTAVMGPSGAGKTTFLTALAGKSTGCIMTGLVLINGKPESIYSYKKIIGYVPQDDIVHGNLTVEENLRFSARCRLSADMPKPDKVLVVERVIESLGLQAVRDSLVGTVEKRGISGGQRKRVNVGLEMVMEPSLLILDEPTTGLDSASSQLLLRSLRREALEGVNICMVLHQPSYSLFKMFDDLVLLAKGGLTAYHGPVKKVEEYFAGIGITVPERVNPPDHFIDILEGLEKPKGVTREQLPVRWMLHNGYPVPPDMLKLCDFDTSASDSTRGQNTKDDAGEPSIAGNVRQDVKSNVEMQHDHFLSHKDLSNRRTPGLARQFRYFIGRVTKQRLREAKIQLTDYLMLLLAGACLGTLAKVNDETFDSLGYTFTVIAISLLCKIAALRSFSLDKLQYWRESASGISSLAHFLAKDTLDLFNTIIKPLFYLSMFYFFNNPRSSFSDNYIVLVCLVYCVTGMAYAFAIYLQPAPAQLWSVLLPVVLTLIANQEKDSPVVKYLGNLCYPKWALEGFVIANAERYSGVWLITRCTSLMENGYDLHDWHRSLVMLILFGVVSRVAAFFLMITFQKK